MCCIVIKDFEESLKLLTEARNIAVLQGLVWDPHDSLVKSVLMNIYYIWTLFVIHTLYEPHFIGQKDAFLLAVTVFSLAYLSTITSFKYIFWQ